MQLFHRQTPTPGFHHLGTRRANSDFECSVHLECEPSLRPDTGLPYDELGDDDGILRAENVRDEAVGLWVVFPTLPIEPILEAIFFAAFEVDAGAKTTVAFS